MISSSWYAVLDMNDEETISRVLTSFRNQSSRFLSHQYHLGGMCLQSLMLISDRTKTTHSVPLILIQRILIPIIRTHTFRMPISASARTITHRFWLRSFRIRYVSLIGTLFFWIRYLGAGYMLYHLGGISIMCRYF